MHIYSLAYGQAIICYMICYYDIYMMGLGANFTMRENTSSTYSYANCHYDIYQDTLST